MSGSSTTIGPDRIESLDDLDPGEKGVFEYWAAQDRIAEKEEGQWPKRSRRIVARYRDERPESIANVHRFNILWSNVQTLLPTLYARTPKPDVQRRFKDQDDVGRLASMLLERSIAYSLENGHFDAAMLCAVMDRLLPGRGTVRVLYVPHFGDEIREDPEFEDAEDAASIVDAPGDEGAKEAAPLREVVGEEVIPRYVFWEDYREGSARTWEEVPWVRYRAFMTRAELVERFGKRLGNKVNLDYPKHATKGDVGRDDPSPDLFKKAVVHEYWNKLTKEVVWIAPGTPDIVLDTVDDPLGLPDFFPSADPLLATTTTDKRIPVPDYIEYQDQASELDRLTARIDNLTRALKVSGIYPGAEKQVLQQLIDAGTENRLIPVNDWVPFADKGGLQNFIQFMPIKEIAETLIQLYDARDRVKQILYEITGIGDILRGETVPNETATAQQLKSNFATRRIVPQQRAVARFARDLVRLMGAVIAGHFSAETIAKMTGYPQLLPVPELPPAPQQWVPDPRAMAAMAAQQQQAAQAQPPPANDIGPPVGALREGAVTHFRNGQGWTMRGGQAVRVA